jgi:hypothetical protein
MDKTPVPWAASLGGYGARGFDHHDDLAHIGEGLLSAGE